MLPRTTLQKHAKADAVDLSSFSPGELAGLRRLNDGRADFLELAHVGATGAEIALLVQRGLVTDVTDSVWKTWAITDDGRKVLAGGC